MKMPSSTEKNNNKSNVPNHAPGTGGDKHHPDRTEEDIQKIVEELDPKPPHKKR